MVSKVSVRLRLSGKMPIVHAAAEWLWQRSKFNP